MIETFIRFINLAADRVRGLALRARGAQVARKVNVGRHCNFVNATGLRLGKRSVLERNVFLEIVRRSAICEIGEYTFSGNGGELDNSSELFIGNNTLIAPGVFITDHNHAIEPHLKIAKQATIAQAVSTGDDVWIGENTTTLPGVSIAKRAVVAAGAVARKAKIIIEYAIARKKLGSDQYVLQSIADTLPSKATDLINRLINDSNFHYHIATRLQNRSAKANRTCYRNALAKNHSI